MRRLWFLKTILQYREPRLLREMAGSRAGVIIQDQSAKSCGAKVGMHFNSVIFFKKIITSAFLKQNNKHSCHLMHIYSVPGTVLSALLILSQFLIAWCYQDYYYKKHRFISVACFFGLWIFLIHVWIAEQLIGNHSIIYITHVLMFKAGLCYITLLFAFLYFCPVTSKCQESTYLCQCTDVSLSILQINKCPTNNFNNACFCFTKLISYYAYFAFFTQDFMKILPNQLV